MQMDIITNFVKPVKEVVNEKKLAGDIEYRFTGKDLNKLRNNCVNVNGIANQGDKSYKKMCSKEKQMRAENESALLEIVLIKNENNEIEIAQPIDHYMGLKELKEDEKAAFEQQRIEAAERCKYLRSKHEQQRILDRQIENADQTCAELKEKLSSEESRTIQEIETAREKAERIKAEFQKKKETREREIIVVDEEFSSLENKHQEEYGNFEMQIAILHQKCDELREQLALAGEQLLMMQCNQAQEKETAEQQITSLAEKRRLLLNELIKEKNISANAINETLTKVDELDKKRQEEKKQIEQRIIDAESRCAELRRRRLAEEIVTEAQIFKAEREFDCLNRKVHPQL